MATDKPLFILLLMACLAVACVKDPQGIPDGFADNPVFTIHGNLDNNTVDIRAGEGGWTMQPLYFQDSSHLVYSSIFSMNECMSECPSSFEFKFYGNYPATLNPSLDFNQSIQPGEVEFVLSDVERDSFLITLSTHPGLFMSGVSSWENINTTGTTYQPELTSIIGYEQNLHVCFQSLAFTGCQYTQCINFDPSTLVPCIAFIEPKFLGQRYISLKVKPQGTPPFDFKWFDGSTEASIVVQVQDTMAEIFAQVEVTDAFGNQSSLAQTIRLQDGFIDPCYFPIEMTSIPVSYATPEIFAGKAEFIYTDSEGQRWTSTNGVQTSDPVITITEVTYFDVSPSGDPAYKVRLQFEVELFNELTGASKYFSVQDAVIALAHP